MFVQRLRGSQGSSGCLLLIMTVYLGSFSNNERGFCINHYRRNVLPVSASLKGRAFFFSFLHILSLCWLLLADDPGVLLLLKFGAL